MDTDGGTIKSSKGKRRMRQEFLLKAKKSQNTDFVLKTGLTGRREGEGTESETEKVEWGGRDEE